MKRPLSITVIAWYYILTGVWVLVQSALTYKSFRGFYDEGVAGFTNSNLYSLVTGSTLYSIVIAVICVILGFGLLRLNSIARTVTIALTIIGFVVILISAVLDPIVNMAILIMNVGAIFLANSAIIFILIKNKKHFVKST